MHFLVLLRSNFDEAPVRLFTDRDEALEFVRTLDAQAAEAQLESIGFTTSDLGYVAIVDFENGVPVKLENIRDLQMED